MPLSCDIHNEMSSANVILARDAHCVLRNNAIRMRKYMVYTWIINALAERDIKQANLARYMDIDPPKLSRSLNGERELKPEETVKISKFLHMPVDWILTGQTHYIGDEALMEQAAQSVLSAAKAKGVKLPLAQAMAFTVELYNHVIKYRKQGENILPSEGVAAFILDKLA